MGFNTDRDARIPNLTTPLADPPTIVVRSLDRQDVKSTSSSRFAGEVEENLYCVDIDVSMGPYGGSATLENPSDLWLKAGRNQGDIPNYDEKIFSIELRENLRNRALQGLIFKGIVGNERGSYMSHGETNDLSFVLSDWAIFEEGSLFLPDIQA